MSNKFFVMPMFPYPSGSGLHVGHASNFMINDVVARFKRMLGYDVIHPFGYDSFGLPTENYAIKQGKPANVVTDENIIYYNNQISGLDLSFDKDRQVITSNPDYYKWTQWIFSKLYQYNLVYRKDGFVNWCPGCQTVLANDQVVDGKCERCESEIIQKKQPQWYVKITDYADKLLDYSDCDWPEETKIHQTNWIGRSEGAEIDFSMTNSEQKITVFTTRPDTVYGVTAIVLAPEIEIIDSLMSDTKKQELSDYRKVTALKTAIDRQHTEKEKTGFDSGVTVIHPLTGELVPVWFADYVLPDYATGAVMFVPAHDERDWEFAKKYGIDIKQVISQPEETTGCYTGTGTLINSGQFDGLDNQSAKKEITKHLESIGKGKTKVTYRLRDWSISRQRYWGSPIPFYYTFAENEKVLYLEYKEGNKVFQPGLSVVTRNVIQIVVKDKNSDNYVFIKRKHDGDVSAFFGGIEGNESFVDAGKRELLEEGGFTDVNFVKEICHYHLKFYHPTKNHNQYSICTTLLFEVDLSKVVDRSDEDKALHEIVSMNADEFLSTSHNDTSIFALNHLLGKSQTIQFGYTDKYNAYNPHPNKDTWIPHPIPDEELPVVLPLDLGNYKPAGKSPLEDHHDFKYYHAKDGNTYMRECDTLDTFMCSSFYFLRYLDAHNSNQLFDPKYNDLLPVDMYIGGKEHTVGHLLYSRFIYKFLKDIGVITNPSKEPFKRLIHQGMVLASDGRKMSKRWGNVIDPNTVIDEFSADTLRVYLMFMGPLEQTKNRNPNAVAGVARFIERVRRVSDKVVDQGGDNLDSIVHQTIKGVREDYESLKFNTAVSKLMVLTNSMTEAKNVSKSDYLVLLQLLAPMATKVTQEMYENIGYKDSIHVTQLPDFDPALCVNDSINLPVQINGKMRGTIEVAPGITQEEVLELVRQTPALAKYVEGEIKKVIFVQDKICNIII